MTGRAGSGRVAGGLPVAVDAMGGDHAPDTIVAGTLAASERGIPVLLVGDRDRLRALIGRSQVPIVHAPEAVGMSDPPTAVRTKPGCAPRVVMTEVASGRACAAVSCGNTGATMVSAMLALPLVPGVTRPAVAVTLPRAEAGSYVLLDAGANTDSRPEHLVGFAALGAAYARTHGVPVPRVGVLSNGHEDGKGNHVTRLALEALLAIADPRRVIVGNVEPHAAMAGACDVLVCDGFVGNVLLKGVEAAAETVLSLVKAEIAKKVSARIGAALLTRALSGAHDRIAWSAYGGGLLLGVRGVVVVAHGRADARAVAAAIELAHRSSRDGLVAAMDASFLTGGGG